MRRMPSVCVLSVFKILRILSSYSLKLKCDKGLPCSRYAHSRLWPLQSPLLTRQHSCKRRGCSEICPNGQLSTGQGTRYGVNLFLSAIAYEAPADALDSSLQIQNRQAYSHIVHPHQTANRNNAQLHQKIARVILSFVASLMFAAY